MRSSSPGSPGSRSGTSNALAYSPTRSKDCFEARRAIELRFRSDFKERQQVSPSEVIEIISAEKEVGTKLTFILAHCEVMAISIFDDLVDGATCLERVGSTFVNTVYVMPPYILENRNNPLDVRRHDYLLVLYAEWSKRIDDMRARGPISRFSRYQQNGNDIRGLRRRLRSEKRAWDHAKPVRSPLGRLARTLAGRGQDQSDPQIVCT